MKGILEKIFVIYKRVVVEGDEDGSCITLYEIMMINKGDFCKRKTLQKYVVLLMVHS